ncbi:MAG: hypothetical protein N0C89_13025, partial [Candidatus Thiodiazotropha endolucinida]|nr:hypothetical protein [Candidatus Thiodiazotropha taylori]MCW4331142.1 hypothetical protein [Candidatus Thiodiazotropha endolucinida]
LALYPQQNTDFSIVSNPVNSDPKINSLLGPVNTDQERETRAVCEIFSLQAINRMLSAYCQN